MNGADCLALTNGFVCDCRPGFQGTNQVKSNPALSENATFRLLVRSGDRFLPLSALLERCQLQWKSQWLPMSVSLGIYRGKLPSKQINSP